MHMADWFKKLKTPDTDEAEEGPRDFFEEILEFSKMPGEEKDHLVEELGDFTDSESVETEIFHQNAKRKNADSPWGR